jgi:STE24 endopeptidase
MTVVPLSTWRPTPADPAEWFAPDELERSRRYQRPLTRLRIVRGAITLATTLILIVGEVGPRLLDALDVEGWVLQLLVMIVLLEVVGLLYNPVLDWWVDLVHDKQWGLSTQTPRGFATDQVKSVVLSIVLSAVLLTPLYALIRSTELWWLWGWLLFVAFSVVAGFLFPVLIAPIFNKFEPLDDAELAGRIQDIAKRAGVSLSGAFVADESRRSTRDNAYVSGLGATRRVILYDTILEHPHDVVCQVVAHEVGHWRRHHLRRQLPILASVALVAFLLLRVLAEWTWLFDQTGVAGIGDPAGLPILLLSLQLAFGVLSGVMAWVSRAFERQADLEALDLLGRPDDMIAMLRALHVKNIADLDPGWLKRLQATHPPPAERMAFTQRWATAG